MLVSCEICSKVRLGGRQWVECDLGAQPLAICPKCMEKKVRQQRRDYYRGVRQVQENCARGYGGPEPGEDVFRGFREDDE